MRRPTGTEDSGNKEEEVHEANEALRRQNRPPPGRRPGVLEDPGPPQARLEVPGGCLAAPQLDTPQLAAPGSDGVDAAALAFLLARNLEGSEEEERQEWLAEEAQIMDEVYGLDEELMELARVGSRRSLAQQERLQVVSRRRAHLLLYLKVKGKKKRRKRRRRTCRRTCSSSHPPSSWRSRLVCSCLPRDTLRALGRTLVVGSPVFYVPPV